MEEKKNERKKTRVTMKDVKAVSAPITPKVRKPGITTNMVNAPVPPPRPAGPVVRGPMITTHDEPLPKGTEALLREIEDKPYAEAYAKKIDADFRADLEGAKKPLPKTIKAVGAEPVKVTEKQFEHTPSDGTDEIPDRDVDDHSKPVPVAVPKTQVMRKPAVKKRKG